MNPLRHPALRPGGSRARADVRADDAPDRTKVRLPVASIAVLLPLLAACSTLEEARCGPGEERSVSELLYFGTAKPGAAVSAEEWSSFLRGAVTPRFPAGFTAWKASGQWQSPGGGITREESYVLNVVHPAGSKEDAAIKGIVSEYKARFGQEAVLRVKADACVSF
jgi:hypothetical protein